MGIILRVKYPDSTPEIIEIKQFPATIGRSSSNDIILNDSTVSARHAVIDNKGGSFVLQDLSSSNGTWLGGRREVAFELVDKMNFRLGDLKLDVMFDDDHGGTRPIFINAEPSRWRWLRAALQGEHARWVLLSIVLYAVDLWVRVGKGGDFFEEGIVAILLPLFFTLPLASGFSLFKSALPKSQVIALSAVRLMPMAQLVISSAQIIEYLSYYWGAQLWIASFFSMATGALALFGAQSAFFRAKIAKQSALAVGTVLILFSVLTTLLPFLPSRFDLSGMKDHVPVLKPSQSGPSRFISSTEFHELIEGSIERLERARPAKERPGI